jgi:transposase
MDWKQLLAYITSSVNEELLLRNEYLVMENRILRHQITGRICLKDAERKTLAEIGKKLGKQALKEVATIVKPDTILAWHRKFVAQKFDSSPQRKTRGRPRIDEELEALVMRLAQENCTWGYDRIVGALANVGYTVSDQTVGNILKRHGIPSAPERKTTTTWHEFIRTHMDVLVATDFFTDEVWTWRGLVTYYVLFFLHLESRRVYIAGVTPQTASKFPFRWWGANSTLSDRHQLDERPGPHSAPNEALDVPESKCANLWGYTNLVRSASFPTGVNEIVTRFGHRIPMQPGWCRWRVMSPWTNGASSLRGSI